MGDFRVRAIKDSQDRSKVIKAILDDIAAMDIMENEGLLNTSHPKIGAEQELCLIEPTAIPSTKGPQILEAITDEHYTNELARFNLEINLDPYDLEKGCFSTSENELLRLLNIGSQIASEHDNRFILSGILPSIRYRHLDFDHMTPIKRYQTLSDVLLSYRKADFQIYLQGVDDAIMSLGSVLFEACNTSFQLHLQMHPKEFVDNYNWSQMISGPVLASAVNSPLLFGKELWAETRIALFKQSLDTRSAANQMRKKLPRVFFGDSWLEGPISSLWKNQLMRFPILLTSDDFKKSTDLVKEGLKPDLRAVNLHNGTSYTWNRLCYGPQGDKPHIRIECRYLPSGPSVLDEVANFAFWIGLMVNPPMSWKETYRNIEFKNVKNNFIKAARYGLEIEINWFGDRMPARKLILERLLPRAKDGLRKYNVNDDDIDRYLRVIENRVETGITGSDWIVRNYHTLLNKYNESRALKILTNSIYDHQSENKPSYEWPNFKNSHIIANEVDPLVEDYMTYDIFCLRADDSMELAKSVLGWKNIHHIPIEDDNGNLVGIMTDGLIMRHYEGNDEAVVREFMIKDFISVNPDLKISQAEVIMNENSLSGLPVVRGGKLIGILTKRDL